MYSSPHCASAEREGASMTWLKLRTLVLLAGLCLTQAAWAASGVITHLSGVLSVIRANGEPRILGVKSDVETGDELVSEDKTFARIRFTDGANLVIRPNSRVKVAAYSYLPDAPQDDKASFNLIKGGLRMVTGVVAKRNPERFETRTETASVGIRGTHFGLLLCPGQQAGGTECEGMINQSGRAVPEGLHIDVLDGAIFVTNEAGTVDVSTGQFGYVRSARDSPQVVPEDDGVRVFVPPSMVARTGDGMTVGLNSNDNQCIIR
jgi:hypothetical protein